MRKNEMAILRRTERNSESNVWYKTDGKKRTEGLKETVVQMAKANRVRWYRHVLRRDDGHVLRKALEFEVMGKRKRE